MKGKETVYVGLSGGVDSSVAAKRLLTRGYTVVGVFIKTWQPDFLVCNWEAERLDAMRVAATLGIPFYTCDAEEAYKTEVAEYMVREYEAGRTPNPDVMCNQHVKFGIFLKYALSEGGDKVATGHYAQVLEKEGMYHLYRGIDTQKDQSYFLWTLTQEQLSKTLFPVGDTKKPGIRTEAEKANIPTFSKEDSQGICFLGQVDMKDFLSHYIAFEKGDVLDTEGNVIGSHDGALLYTLGQRHGFTLRTEATLTVPHYVVQKDIQRNTITVSEKPLETNGNKIVLTHVNKILGSFPKTCMAQFRYRQKPFTVELTDDGNEVILTTTDPEVEMPSIGQSCVLYTGNECLGGGIIDRIV